jgi:hypothetical protein
MTEEQEKLAKEIFGQGKDLSNNFECRHPQSMDSMDRCAGNFFRL